ncbi:MAG: cytochrome-c peroxidase [Elusimicrobiota bacterium]
MTPRLAAAVALILAPAAAAGASDFGGYYPYPVPLGLKAPDVPADNDVTDAKVALGKTLFFDARLSRDSTISCASCHNPSKGWTDQAPVSTGIHGQKGGISAPTVLNAAYMEFQFWDGRAKSLEEQAKGPIQNPLEMGFTHAEAVARLSGIRGYAPLFKAAFGDDKVDIDRIAMAIATFERTVLTGNAPFDRWKAGDAKAMSPAAVAGYRLFNDASRANCAACHDGFNFSDSDFHNTGVGADQPGRSGVTHLDKDKGAFKTPTLRNLKYTGPYMHDGSRKTLIEAIDLYDEGGIKNPNLDSRIKPLHLTEIEEADLAYFLDALNGDPVKIQPPAMPQ